MGEQDQNLRNRQFKQILKEYQSWLEVLGYSSSIRGAYPVYLKDFLLFAERKGIRTLGKIKKAHLTTYRNSLKSRGNQRRKGGISPYHINAHLQAIKKLAEYLLKTTGQILPVEHIAFERIERKEKLYLTKEEVQALFQATHKTSRYGLRDRAFLALYYGCGLRRKEGEHIHTKDIDFLRGFIHVREGKGGVERYVPMSKEVQIHLQAYIKKGRPLFSKGNRSGRLFLSYRGNTIQSQTFYQRLKTLQEKSDCQSLKQKQIGLHSLRHSIATHLLQNNVPLETISHFLGHKSMESTQIYTHIHEETAQRL